MCARARQTELIMVWGGHARFRLERKDEKAPYEEFDIELIPGALARTGCDFIEADWVQECRWAAL